MLLFVKLMDYSLRENINGLKYKYKVFGFIYEYRLKINRDCKVEGRFFDLRNLGKWGERRVVGRKWVWLKYIINIDINIMVILFFLYN